MISYLYGKNVGLTLIENHREIHKLYLSKSAYDSKWQALIAQQNIAFELVDKQRLSALCGSDKHQGVVIAVKEYSTYSLEELLQAVPEDQLGLLVILDGIEDPHNLGAILRNCDGAGAQGVIIAKRRSAPLNATVAKVSSGAIDSVKVAAVSNINNAIKFLKARGYWIVGCSGEGQDLYNFSFDTAVAIVIGAEGKGLSRLVKENCDYLISIPMAGTVRSLNAASASAVVLYQIQHRRSFPK